MSEHIADYVPTKMLRWERDERALVLFSRMLNRLPVWVDSPAGQMTWIQGVHLDDDGEVIAYDHEGNDRRAEDYLLNNPARYASYAYYEQVSVHGQTHIKVDDEARQALVGYRPPDASGRPTYGYCGVCERPLQEQEECPHVDREQTNG